MPARSGSVAVAGALALLLAGLISGCAAVPDAEGGGVRTGASSSIEIAADDSPARKRARTHLELATQYFQNRQYEIALSEAQEAQQGDPTFAAAYNVAGMAYGALGDPGAAEAQFRRAAALNPRDANVAHNLAMLECEGERFAEADAEFNRALELPNANRAHTLAAQGICQARAGQKAQAEETLARAYEFDPGNPITAYNLSQLLYQRGDYERARFYIRRLNNSELANAGSLWLGIRVERRLNDRQAEEQLAAQLRRRFPGSQELLAYERGNFDD